PLGLAGLQGTRTSADPSDLMAVFIGNQRTRAGTATVHADYYRAHERAPEALEPNMDDRIPTAMVLDVPISPYHRPAMRPRGARRSAAEGTACDSGFAKTTSVMAEIPTIIPVITSFWRARRQSMPRKNAPRSPP